MDDLLLVNTFGYQLLQRGHINAALLHKVKDLFQHIHIQLLLMKQKLHLLILHGHDAGVRNVFPDFLCIRQVIHTDKGPVQGAHAGACNAFYLHARFPHSFPRAYLIRTLRTAALQDKTVFLCKINYRFHD